ncbi:MAG: phenylacetic acid degradation operon negative regulatory protein PaaX [Ilumatobacter sp.]|nr:phenylacetic acid degradation operon negative regulatory protein PaaX [Ilumatobacter sp.]
MADTTRPSAALDDLVAASCSNGAPSARNLLVTVFGDALLPYGPATSASPLSLAELLDGFGVNERLVRTSLTRLVNDDLLAVDVEGRRSFYRVAVGALDVFARADSRIYGGAVVGEWDGSWTVVVIDGAEATADQRAALRQELSWAGFGTVAPNVMASPLTPPHAATTAIRHAGPFEQVLVTTAQVVDDQATLGPVELAERCAPLDGSRDGYEAFIARFRRFENLTGELDDARAFKLRILLVASFRRLVLADPLLPAELLPADWPGHEARRLAGSLYRSVAERAERHLLDHLEPSPGRRRSGVARRFV